MKVLAIHEMGPESRLVFEQRETPEPSGSQVLVENKAFGINRADLLQRDGRYPAPPGTVQDVPGLEFAGVITQLGPDSRAARIGDRVMGIVPGGAYATHVLTEESHLLQVPDGMEFADAASIPEAYVTAWDAMVRQGNLQAGENVLIHAAGSGVGLAAIQLCLAAGAHPVGTSRTPEKLRRLEEQFSIRTVLRDEQWPEHTLALEENGFDVLLDLVGGKEMGWGLRVLAMSGRIIVVGLTAGVHSELRLNQLLRKRATVKGTVLRSRTKQEKTELTRAFRQNVLPFFGSGRLRSLCEERYSVEQIQLAHERMRANSTFGKLVVDWS